MRVLSATGQQVVELAFSPAGDALAATIEDGGVYLWNLTAGTAAGRKIDSAGSSCPQNLSFAPDGRSVSWLGNVGLRTWDRDTTSLFEVGLNADTPPYEATRTPAGDRMVTLHSLPGTMVGWRAVAGGWEKEWDVSTDRDAVLKPVLAPAGDRLALLTQVWKSPRDVGPFRVQVRSVVSGTVQATSPFAWLIPPEAFLFSPDGTRLVAVQKMTLLVWPVPELGEPRRVRVEGRKHFTAAAFHPSGRYLFASSHDGSVHVFDTETWTRTTRFDWKLGRLRSVAVSPDGALAAAGGDGGQVVAWDLDL